MLSLLRRRKRAVASPDSVGRVILISLDCVRPETLGFYGDNQARAPNIGRIVDAGVRFTQAIAQAPYTPASHASILTGVNPYRHGIRTIIGRRLAPSIRTLPEMLQRQGYSTAAFISTQALSSAYGLDRGFGIYDEDFTNKIGWWHTGYKRPCRETTENAVAWLQQRASDEPFFLLLHYIDAHSMTGKRFSYSYQMRQVEKIDKQLRRVLAVLRRRKWIDSAMIVIVSDHGDSFGEHGEKGHREYLYDTTLRIPLAIKFPAHFPDWARGRTVNKQVRSVDIAPTILDTLGLLSQVDREADCFDGVSLLDVCSGDSRSHLLAYSETCHEVSAEDWGLFKTHYLALRDGRWKYIFDKLTGDEELYELPTDPGELDNLALRKPDVASRLRSQLANLTNERLVDHPAQSAMSASDRARVEERLRELGYLE